jgi:hypothetical protein
LGLLFDVEAGLFGTCPPAPGAPVLPWLPDIGLPLDPGAGEPWLPGAALVEFGMPGPVVVRGSGTGELIGAAGGEDIGRGTIVLAGGIAIESGVACAPPIEPPGPGCPPRATAVARQMYIPIPLP